MFWGFNQIKISDSQIEIRESGDWYFRDRKLINRRILAYFKSNLHRDEGGIYILNTYREFVEKGYVTIRGPVLSAASVLDDRIVLEDNSEIPFHSLDLNLYKETLLFSLPILNVWGKFSRDAYLKIADFIEDKDEAFYFLPKSDSTNNAKIPEIKIINWMNAKIKE